MQAQSFIEKAISLLSRLRGPCESQTGKQACSSKGYLPAKQTVEMATRSGLSVCDYVEKIWQQQGSTEKVVGELVRLGVFDGERNHILEIGAGTGRYLEKVLQVCRPELYESYETARDWSDWLQGEYPIISRDANGDSLGGTKTNSVDVIHAHGLFVYVPFLVSCRYFREIFRVAGKESWVAFDVLSEDCFDKTVMDRWLDSAHDYPCFLSTDFVVSLFVEQGFSLVSTFMNDYGEGRSKYLVFKKQEFSL